MLKKMFYKWGIVFFDTSKPQYGGFNHWISKYIFRYQIHYLSLSINKDFEFSFFKTYYDGYHNVLRLGFLHIYYQN